MTTKAEQLATYFARMQFKDLPTEHIDQIKNLVLDYLGVALAGSRTKTGQIAAEFAGDMGGIEQSTLIGGFHKGPAPIIAFANAIASHSVELDDVDDLALFHYSPPVVSASLAVAETTGATGKEFLTAVLAGCEMMNRLSLASNPALRNRGFHTTSACGVFGAAVASSKLLHLTPEQIVNSMGLAGAQAGGLMEFYGTSMQKRFNPGPAARNGVTSALLAQKGFTGADTIFEGERGFGHAMSGAFDAETLTKGLGKEIPVILEFKAYSSARPIHNAVDCALLIRNQYKPTRMEDVEKIEVYRHPDWADFHVIQEPRTYHEAQVSLPYSTAVALLEGAALLPQYTDEKIHDSQIIGLSKKVTVLKDASLPRGVSCNMILTTQNGESYSAQVDYPKGSTGNPFTDDELAAKFRKLASTLLDPKDMEKVIETVARLEDVQNIDELIKLVRVP